MCEPAADKIQGRQTVYTLKARKKDVHLLTMPVEFLERKAE